MAFPMDLGDLVGETKEEKYSMVEGIEELRKHAPVFESHKANEYVGEALLFLMLFLARILAQLPYSAVAPIAEKIADQLDKNGQTPEQKALGKELKAALAERKALQPEAVDDIAACDEKIKGIKDKLKELTQEKPEGKKRLRH